MALPQRVGPDVASDATGFVACARFCSGAQYLILALTFWNLLPYPIIVEAITGHPRHSSHQLRFS